MSESDLFFGSEAPFGGVSRVHFVGIGGIGMSSLARWFLSQNRSVSGSDVVPSEITRELQKLGLKVKIGHKRTNLPSGSPEGCLVVYSQAIKASNPELMEAHRRKINAISYPQALGELTRKYETIAVAGMHGKSTTTALLSLALVKTKLDPTVIIGAKLKEFDQGNFRQGNGKYLVIEADEYGGAFLNYSPILAVVTNIDREHLDFYKDIADIKRSFLRFLGNVRENGTFVLNRDNKILFSLGKEIRRIAGPKKINIIWYSLKNAEAAKIKKIIEIPGSHNLSNSVAAVKAAKALRVSEKTALKAISKYRGAERRMEYRGRLAFGARRLTIYDDYAHHPAEIKATLRAFREEFPGRHIVCVFQPHQAERLKALFREFQSAFDDADLTVILPVYRVPGRDASDSKFTSERLVEGIQKKYPEKPVFYIASQKDIKKQLSVLLRGVPDWRKSPVLVMMGAGDIVKYTNNLIES